MKTLKLTKATVGADSYTLRNNALNVSFLETNSDKLLKLISNNKKLLLRELIKESA